ncbi:MAG: GTP-binding protein [Limisphaerales bacterium]
MNDETRVERGKSPAERSAPRPSDAAFDRARYLMIGGFLGAGKTTAVARLAQRLTGQGLRVGLITNDQGSELVDTATLRSRGFATEEIPGGCFCCRFNSLVEAAKRLSAQTRPDVFIAEPVGSCTDLVATVTYPLRRMYRDRFTIAPLSVLVDPIRALRVFGVETGGKFSEKVRYIYRKQLEEADLIVINKSDLLDESRRAALRQTLVAHFPETELFEVSARTGLGLDAWFDRITTSRQDEGTAMEVDYTVYAEGEALLGWLNCTVELSAPAAFDGNRLMSQLATDLQRRLNGGGAEIAHLKMTLSPDDGLGGIAVINVVRNDFVPELSQSLADELQRGQLIINLRAEAAPETLAEVVKAALETCGQNHPGCAVTLDHLERFQPGKPTPTHRIATLI